MSSIETLLQKIHIVRNEAEAQILLEKLSPDQLHGPLRIAFVNAHALNLCHKNPDFLQNLLACDYVFRDGSGMKILYQMLGWEEGINMNGTDFIPRLLSRYQGKTIALMGTQSPHLENSADKISGMGLNPVLTMDGFHDDTRYAQALSEKPASFVLLAMGMPKQERVASLIAEKSASCIIVCGGAILDFIAEKVQRAPDFFRRYGIEWVYRLAQEPKRLFGRYVIGNAIFLVHALNLSRKMKQERRSSMKVLHVVRQYSPAIGGLESYVQNMVRHQKALGYDCEVLTLNKIFHGDGEELPSIETIEDIPVKRVRFFGKRRFFIPMVSPLYFGKFDVVHVHNTDVFYDYIALIAMLTKTPCFATTHGGFFHTKDFSLIKKIYFNTITRFSSLFYKTIFAISQNDYDTFKPLNKNVVLQPNAIEPLGDDIFSGADFLYVGRLAEHKKVDRALEVFARLKKQHGIAGKFHVIGPEWDVTISGLREVAASHDVADDVIFHGSASGVQMKSIASSCGYFISASTFEGFGMSMLEGMSVGLVPLVQRNESFEELVTQSGVGLLTDFNETDKAAAEIAAFLAKVTPAQRTQAQTFSRRFSWKGLVENTSKYYADALK